MCSIIIRTDVRLTLPPQLGLAAPPPAPAAAPEPGGRPPAPYAAVEPARGDLAADRGVADGEVGALEEDPALELLGRPSPLEDARPDELQPLGVVEQPGVFSQVLLSERASLSFGFRHASFSAFGAGTPLAS